MIKMFEIFLEDVGNSLPNSILEQKRNRFIIIIYLWLEGILFFLIKWAEASRPFSVYGKVEYSAIVLNFLVMLYFYLGKRRSSGSLKDAIEWKIPLALTLTLIADYFLTLTDTHFLLGVFSFFLVQLVYGWRIGYHRGNAFFRMILFAAFAGAMILLGMDLSFSVFCGLSIAALIGNVSCSFHRWQYTSKKYDGWFFLGLLLFAGCDLNLGITLITYGVEGLSGLHFLTGQMVWICYIPSQVLLTLVSIFDSENQENALRIS